MNPRQQTIKQLSASGYELKRHGANQSAPGITNDIDGCSDHLRKMSYVNENQFAICITQDNMDEIRKIVSESTNVKFPEKRQQRLDMIDSMGPDDNPILAIYKLKD